MASSTVEYDPINFGFELQEQLASSSRSIGFLLGAGSSMAAGLPDLKKLTDDVASGLSLDERARFNELRGATGNLETVLNRTRALREILGSTDVLWGLTQDAAVELDRSICRIAYDLISGGGAKPTSAHIAVAHWTQQSHRTTAVEFFTTNYDLLLESAFESIGLPFFDGFVGSVQPFFVPQMVDPTTASDLQLNALPSAWARLWKLHGSIGWRFIEDPITRNKKIIRVSGTKPSGGDEVVIYPSRDKYSESRRLPYLTYIDRFRRFLAAGERILLINGYSFGDEHLNEVLRQGLQSNSRLAIHAFFFGDIAEEAKRAAVYHPNLAAMGRKDAIIGAVAGTWRKPAAKPKPGEKWHCWDDAKDEFVLGNFTSFGEFLGAMVGSRSTTSPPVPSKP
jgi:hypothetical protein